MGRNILIVEDNAVAHHFASHLREHGFSVTVESTGEAGLSRASSHRPDLLILSRRLPGTDGLEICRRLRAAGNSVPVFMLGERTSELDRVLGLEMGADDYLTKPLSIQELCARVRAFFRRLEMLSAESDRDLIQIKEVCIDLLRHEVTIKGRAVALTAKEFDLLSFLARHPGQVFTRGQLLAQVWGYGHDGYEHTVNSHINRLRGKIETDPAHPQHIVTVHGVGYKFHDYAGFSA